MKPAPFRYESVSTVSQATERLTMGDGEAKLLAGSQSLGPMLNLRLARPASLIDVSSLGELRACHERSNAVELGAAITHAEIEDGEVQDPTGGWLMEAASNIAHRAVRNRGTLGGSLVHADPAADWVIVMTGLNAMVCITGPEGRREVPMDSFVIGPYQTVLARDEVVTAVRVERPSKGARWAYRKFVRQVGEFAKASATVLSDPQRSAPRIVVGALGRQPLVIGDETSRSLLNGDTLPADALRESLPEKTSTDLVLHAAVLNRALEAVRDADAGAVSS